MCYRPIIYNKMLVPCRQCLQCRQQRANEWALRCMLECNNHTKVSFITLTYAPPSPLILSKSHVQNFVKRLRKAIQPLKIKYFFCGEYGSHTHRPHYHAIIFGYDFPDKIKSVKSHSGNSMYISNQLATIWGKGYCTVQDVTIDSCAYCALYASPIKSHLPEHLRPFGEFNLMSQGLGVSYAMEHMDTYLATDEIYYDGKPHKIPQAFLNKIRDDYPDVYKFIKDKRFNLYAQNNAAYLANLNRYIDLVETLTKHTSLNYLDDLNDCSYLQQEYLRNLDDIRYHVEKKPKKFVGI